MSLRSRADDLLNRLASVVFPVVLVALSLAALLWQLSRPGAPVGSKLSVQVWEQAQPTDPGVGPDWPSLLQQLDAQTPRPSVETKLSVQPFWLALKAQQPQPQADWAVEFPSRHAMQMSCWDRQTLALVGQADRNNQGGQMVHSQGGFALDLNADQSQLDLICQAHYRGPARIVAEVWRLDALNEVRATHDKLSSKIEAGFGVLALSMMLMALINRSVLYWAFVGWLLLNMRMAALSSGTDFMLFGTPIPSEWLIPMRHWTVCTYAAATVALFSKLFKAEISRFSAHKALTGLQLSGLLLLVCASTLSFEQTLPVLWLATVAGIAIMLSYLYRILKISISAAALWYAAAIVINLLASLNEVVAAALGLRALVEEINSLTAAMASALLVSAAAAEHMRMGRKEKEDAQRTLKAAYNDSPIGLFTLRAGEQIINCNPAFKAMLKLSAEEAAGKFSVLFEERVGLELLDLQSGGQAAAIELNARRAPAVEPGTGRAQAAEAWFAIKASTLDGSIIEGSVQDISEQVQATQRLEFLVNHDPLTECLNLRGLARRFKRSLSQPESLAYFDLDRFKLINDLYGHAAGDKVLIQVCERMRSQLGADDLLARVGGDEFVIAFSSKGLVEARQCCENICALVAASPFQIDAQRFALSISAGLVATEHFRQSALKEIVSAADTLCRMAKKRPAEHLVVMESGNNFFQHHQDELALISCLERNEIPEGLFLLMQPEISLHRPYDSLNFEVLLRMRKPNGETVPAPVIIEAAEAHGKTAIIDMWVVSTVIYWLETHAADLQRTRFVGVNLSGGSLNDEVFIEALFALLNKHPKVVPLLCIEITETVALTDMGHMQKFIDRARAIGAKVGLDDFGAGYSSFGYLKGLSVDALKLDGSLVCGAAENPAAMAILVALSGLAKSLGMKSIGEFAEDLPTIKALVRAGVDYAQGYGISKPVTPERILAARSCADFIDDPDILAFVTQLQVHTGANLALLPESSDRWISGVMH